MEITELIKHPERMDRDTLYELRSILALHPYFQTVRLLMLQNLYLLHDPSFDEELRRAAIYVTISCASSCLVLLVLLVRLVQLVPLEPSTSSTTSLTPSLRKSPTKKFNASPLLSMLQLITWLTFYRQRRQNNIHQTLQT